ncbi:hypothetical protein HDU85_005891 [Gaertneriomyces sp. JEL0708]|nr:hypothetical protein HDU85_005891 [Gaertneriomyces sp. JEL0708]
MPIKDSVNAYGYKINEMTARGIIEKLESMCPEMHCMWSRSPTNPMENLKIEYGGFYLGLSTKDPEEPQVSLKLDVRTKPIGNATRRARGSKATDESNTDYPVVLTTYSLPVDVSPSTNFGDAFLDEFNSHKVKCKIYVHVSKSGIPFARINMVTCDADGDKGNALWNLLDDMKCYLQDTYIPQVFKNKGDIGEPNEWKDGVKESLTNKRLFSKSVLDAVKDHKDRDVIGNLKEYDIEAILVNPHVQSKPSQFKGKTYSSYSQLLNMRKMRHMDADGNKVEVPNVWVLPKFIDVMESDPKGDKGVVSAQIKVEIDPQTNTIKGPSSFEVEGFPVLLWDNISYNFRLKNNMKPKYDDNGDLIKDAPWSTSGKVSIGMNLKTFYVVGKPRPMMAKIKRTEIKGDDEDDFKGTPV